MSETIDITNRLMNLEKALAEGVSQLRAARLDAVNKRLDYDQEKAKEHIAVVHEYVSKGEKKPTDPYIEAKVRILCKNTRKAAYLAETEVEVGKEYVNQLKAELSSVQTRANLLKAELSIR